MEWSLTNGIPKPFNGLNEWEAKPVFIADGMFPE
jgi:hypothetical protein